jgi:predicted helicase
MKHKMVTLSPDTHKIASNMDNFSGWMRARLRQFDEGVDLVAIEIAKDYLRLQFKTLWAAVQFDRDIQDAQDIWERFNEMMTQSKLGDFE